MHAQGTGQHRAVVGPQRAVSILVPAVFTGEHAHALHAVSAVAATGVNADVLVADGLGPRLVLGVRGNIFGVARLLLAILVSAAHHGWWPPCCQS
ncbi:hypothetical protein HZA86_05465 [Candidatus Uhrbacteria bacterium]|nr:hypothetical protein [Candidatus Uhrbacteria bacterium]